MVGSGVEDEIRILERMLRERGLTNEQVRAGIKYYTNFCRRFDINPARSARMIVRMIENMRRRYEEL
ncbi:MAG: hypothetical protein QXG48_02830 [Thermofilaceae archaeon]